MKSMLCLVSSIWIFLTDGVRDVNMYNNTKSSYRSRGGFVSIHAGFSSRIAQPIFSFPGVSRLE